MFGVENYDLLKSISSVAATGVSPTLTLLEHRGVVVGQRQVSVTWRGGVFYITQRISQVVALWGALEPR